MIFRSNKLVLLAALITVSVLVGACSSGGSDNTTSSADDTAGGTTDETGGTTGETSDGTTDGTTGNSTIGGENVPLDAPISWNLGGAGYVSPVDMPGVQQNIAGRVIVSTADEVSANGDFTGSRLFLHLTQGGSGNYTVVDNFDIDTITGSGANVAYVIISAGTETGDLAETDWESVTGLVSVTVDNNGIYHVSTIEPLTLTRKSDQSGGIPDSPDQISFEMQNIHGVTF